MNEPDPSPGPDPCPKCGGPLPVPNTVVCPHCDAILRSDLEKTGTGSEVRRPVRFGLMIVGAILVFAVTSTAFGLGVPFSLILAGIYLIAFQISARKTNQPVKLMALSLFTWLGICAVIIAILCAGCLVVFHGGFGG